MVDAGNDDELRDRIERRRRLRIGGASQEEVDADWQNIPLPQPPRSQTNWSAFGWLATALAAWGIGWAMMRLGERMVDAVLAIQWPI